jgi:hypothetical protein
MTVMANHFEMVILGRTIEHLGTQMYKHRAPSIAELIANAWDAGAKNVWVSIPTAEEYRQENSIFSILDDGAGMAPTDIQNHYLVVGRNRRETDGGESHGRKVMGRKGIGKLAGFGLASKVTVTSWVSRKPPVRFSMSLAQLTTKAGQAKGMRFPWRNAPMRKGWPKTSGTIIELSDLRHASALDIDSLREILSRRFSRVTRGQMKIWINREALAEPNVPTIFDFPSKNGFTIQKLPSGNEIQYRYSFAEQPIRSKDLQGFAIYAHGRTAQAPPFFFNVESTASSQHSTRYVFGEIIADYLDDGSDSEGDVISTDRQEVDWEKDDLRELREWGQAMTRRVLRECSDKKGSALENWIIEDDQFTDRLGHLDAASRKQISSFLKVLGQKVDRGDDRTRELADSLIRAYEFRNFHDVVGEIENASTDAAELETILGRLHDWKVLESRAILEIVKGRLSIIEKLREMILADAPETASSKSHDNLHDLMAEYPWMFNPDWQVFAEEKQIGKQLRAWGNKDCPDDMKTKRIDFLAFHRDSEDLVVIELKRPGHPVEYNEVVRLQGYQTTLMSAHPITTCVLVFSGQVNIPENKWNSMLKDPYFVPLRWSDLFKNAKKFYSHYESVLEGHSSSTGFRAKEIEVGRTRKILDLGSSHRGKADRKRGPGESSR